MKRRSQRRASSAAALLAFAIVFNASCGDEPSGGNSGGVAGTTAAGAGAGSAAPPQMPTTAGAGGNLAPAAAGSGGKAGDTATVTAGAGGAAGAPGAGGGGGAAPAGAPTFTAIYQEILTKSTGGNCMFCHGPAPDPTNTGNLQIKIGDQAGAYMNLVNVMSTSTLCASKGLKLVVPGDAEASLLIQKFKDVPPCGMKMPIGTPLTAAQVQQITTWINQGAVNN